MNYKSRSTFGAVFSGLSAVALLCVTSAAAFAFYTGEAVWVEGEDATADDFNQHSWYGSTDVRLDLLSPGVPEDSDGAWLVHYTGEDDSEATASYEVEVPAAGTYTWWARLGAHNAAYEYRAGDGDWERVVVHTAPVSGEVVRAPHEKINLVQPGIDIRTLGWVELGVVELDAGTQTVQIKVVPSADFGQTHGGVDAMLLVDQPWSPSGAVQPDDVPAEGDPGGWFPLIDAASDTFDDDSIIDMTDLVAAHTGIPAGSYGHVRRAGEHLELSERPGEPVKFWGANSSIPAEADAMERQARFYVKHGVNLVRRHYMLAELGQDQDPDRLGRYDRWFATLKEHGVYTDWSVFYPDNMRVTDEFLPAWDAGDSATDQLRDDFQDLLADAGLSVDDLWQELPESGGGRRIGGFDNFVYAYQQGQWEWLEPLLLHENPHTGMRYVDDPALAIVEVQNEDSIFFHWPLNELADGTYPNHALLLRRMWFEWLAERYADDAELAQAWGDGLRARDSVETFDPDIKIYGAWEMQTAGPANAADEAARMGDFIRFLAETQRAHFQRRYDRLRDAGFGGVVLSTAWKAGGPAAGAANLWTDDAADMISRHSYRGGGEGGHHVATGPVNDFSHLDTPGGGILSVGLWQVEDKPFAMTEWNVLPPNPWRAEIAPLWAFYGMGLQGWDASLHFSGSGARFRMGGGWPGAGRGPSSYVTETPAYMAQFPALAFAVYSGHVQQAGAAAARRLPIDDIFQGVDALEQDFSGGGWDDPTLVGNVATPPEVLAIGRVSAKIADGLDPSSRVDWERFWDEAGEVVESMTGELTWDYGRRLVTVETERTQGVVGFAGGETIMLPDVEVSIDSQTPYVSLLFTPLDDAPLAESKSILVTALARDKQVGTEYAQEGAELAAVGGPPLLLEPVQAQMTFSGEAIEEVRAVDFYGVPTQTQVERDQNSVTIDGRYQTYYYHVRRAGWDEPPDEGDADPTADAGAVEDTGGSGRDAGGAGGEDAAVDRGQTSEGGCSCRTGGSGPAGGFVLVLVVVGFWAARRRRVPPPVSSSVSLRSTEAEASA